ncbi:hypothetical protein GCM10017044_07800 [Kordiimonas sediminis]|uniref:Uncharacterized protein n=1 Tax=Kordiimonas sediminis TaxID=1735581 RepID=A0A919ANT5_9PROT|nr:hypothetical protein [Kordiimonas sediminis]GHF15980.1 hypothetical protein GCM10017044_07800 [Kordiimonas sediminis]
MATTKVHFEILGKKGHNWTILGVIDQRDKAIREAENLWATGRYDGVRILKESFDRATNEFATVEIFSRGIQRKKSKYDESGSLSPCLTPDDLYAADGRRSIWDLLGNTLESWSITVTELLYNIDNFNKLDNTGTLMQNAVQRVAISIEDNSDSVQERMRKLYTVINMAVSIIKAEAANVPSLAMGRLAPLITELEDKQNKTFLLTASIVEYIAPATTIIDKFGRLIMFASSNRPVWAAEILDQMLAECLLHARLVSYLLNDEGNKDRGDYMLRLMYLQAGKIEAYYEIEEQLRLPQDTEQFDKYLGEGILPRCQKRLVEMIVAELSSTRPINTAGIVKQLEALNKIMNAAEVLITDEGIMDQIDDAIKTRSGRLINSQVIGELLYDTKNPFAQMNLLLDLEQLARGNSNKRTVANFILPILTRSNYEGIFIGMDGHPLECMKKLVSLQHRVIDSGLTEMHKRQIAEKLDSFAKTIMKNTQILKKIHQMDSSIQDKAIRILHMITDGYFTDGASKTQAEAQVKLYMKQDGFTEGLITGLDRKQQETALIDFRELLLRANLS